MHALLISFVTFFFTFSASRIGPLIHAKLPSSDTAKESQDVVRLGMGLVATMTALLLGLVTAAATRSVDTQDAAIKTSAANILTLDRHLAHFGAEAQPIRDLLRRALEYRIAMMWPSGQTSRASLDVPQNVSAAEEVQNRILELHAETDARAWHK